jgi:hypothetical protein
VLSGPFFTEKKKKIGGNGPFLEFMQSYAPAEQGGYKEGMSTHDKYHCWAATQYREKVVTFQVDIRCPCI